MCYPPVVTSRRSFSLAKKNNILALSTFQNVRHNRRLSLNFGFFLLDNARHCFNEGLFALNFCVFRLMRPKKPTPSFMR